MSAGRTTWFAKDAGWWRRGKVAQIGMTHGPLGPAVLDWLTCEAKAQGPTKGHDGTVKAGYAAIAHGCFTMDVEAVEAVVATCVEVGALDDFDELGGTFTCRISGWHQDVEMPLAAARKAAQRAKSDDSTPPGDNGGHSGTAEDKSPDVPLHGEGEGQNKDASHLVEPDRPDVDGLNGILAELMLANEPKAKVAPQSKRWRDDMRLLIDRDKRPVDEVERVIRWCQADQFWRSNILSPGKLREKYTALLLRMHNDPAAGRANGGGRPDTLAARYEAKERARLAAEATG